MASSKNLTQMHPSLILNHPWSTITAFSITFYGPLKATAQDFTTQVGEAIPSSLYGPLSIVDPTAITQALGLQDGIKGGFSYQIGIDSTYDSNFFLEETNTNSELITIISPTFVYVTDPEGGAPFSINANYRPIIRTYLENSDQNGINHSGNINAKVVGAKTVLEANIRYTELSATDRITSEFVTGTLLSLQISGIYQIAPRTRLSASATSVNSDYKDSDSIGSDIYTTRLGALWSATERLQIGPALRYTKSESENTGSIDTWALFMETQYRLAQRIQLLMSLGFDYTNASRNESNDEIGLAGDLSALYAINEHWTWQNSIRSITLPSPDEQNYLINNLGLSSQLNRQLLRASISIGLDMNISDYERIDDGITSLNTDTNFGIFTSYTRQLFTERLDIQARVRWATNEGKEDWSQFQVSAGLTLSF
jgi:hypothetical protein